MTDTLPVFVTMAERAGLGTHRLPDRVDPDRLDLVEEFMATPLGRHSEELTLLLGRMRSSTAHGPALLVERSGDGWTVLEGPTGRGGSLRPVATVATREDAERWAFAERWRRHTGRRLDQGALDQGALDQGALDQGAADQDAAVAALAPEGQRTSAATVLGYVDPPSSAPGGVVRCHLSAPGPVDVAVVRVRPGTDRGAPGWPQSQAVGVAPVAGAEPGLHAVHPGSFGVVDLGALTGDLADGCTLQATVSLPLLPGGRQVVLAYGDPWGEAGVALWVGPGPVVGVSVAVGSRTEEVTAPLPAQPWQWSTLTATVGQGALELTVRRPRSDVVAEASTPIGGVSLPAGSLVVGAVAAGGGGGTVGSGGVMAEHLDGRIEQIAVLRPGPLTDRDAAALATAGTDAPADLVGRIVGWWDLSTGIDGWRIVDRGPHHLDGQWHNLPRRAVTGSQWDGTVLDWRAAPGQFAAAHLLADAVEDCGWPVAMEVVLPDGLASGVYAFEITGAGGGGGGERTQLPFFVRPGPGRRQPITVLMPTATYGAYANSRFWWEDPIQEAVSDRLVEIGAGDRVLVEHPELGLSNYDVHADGTDVCHVSTRRPNQFLRADNRHDEGYCSDLDLIAWLDDAGYTYDVITDQDLHFHPELLDDTSVLLTGTHPEYVSVVEFDAVDRFVRRGGRVMYLGGNGWQTRVTFSPERPWIMENRRVEHWSGVWPGKAAEHHLATDGERGGYLAAGGRTARRLMGVETVTMGFDESRPFVRPGPGEPFDGRAAFVFTGVDATVVGDHGRLGGAVVGQEWDNSLGGELPEDHLVLARTTDHTIVPALFGASREPYHGEMTLRFDRSGGAVWAIGSMAWCAALADDCPGGNDVARITRNVLDRFLDPEPFAAPGPPAP